MKFADLRQHNTIMYVSLTEPTEFPYSYTFALCFKKKASAEYHLNLLSRAKSQLKITQCKYIAEVSSR